MKIAPVVAVACLAGSAAAQTFEPRIAFRADHINSTTPTIQNGGVHVAFPQGSPHEPLVLDFSILMGAFNAQGFTNEGMYSWFGNLTATGTGFSIGIGPLPSGNRPPFNFSPAGNGVVEGTSINNIDAARIPLVTTVWNEEDADPQRPNWTQGLNSYFSVFRFRITITDLTAPREIFINASGLMTAVADFFFLNGEPGGPAEWVAGPFVENANAAGGFTLFFVPGPGAAALLALGGLAAARRRR